ncbi:hypothetical protein BZG36_00415 [Bifiguratus adelaidae]|uniref:Pyridoxamine 5'-phosphate oxidase Alr4036 family FMN-binding domain-containing protein n=1 Tax=Bifiguratus adelaidae TaxID=1938954 RepID=A0A261Y800_9FUNG|nr:hypothetical protein BZG36_00415 [Bifiguratus adelaidae]
MEWKQRIEKQLAANIKEVKDAAYVQLATVANGRPANRTVVFRGFIGEDHSKETEWQSDLLCFDVDIRTPKIKQIEACPFGEICWWMSKTGDQFRLTGQMHLIANPTHPVHSSKTVPDHLAEDHICARHPEKGLVWDWEQERVRQWEKCSPGLRANWVWPSPGQPKASNDPSSIMQFVPKFDLKEPPAHPNGQQYTPEEHQELARLGKDHFVILAFEVERVDHYKPYEQPQQRVIFEKQEGTGEWKMTEVNP